MKTKILYTILTLLLTLDVYCQYIYSYDDSDNLFSFSPMHDIGVNYGKYIDWEKLNIGSMLDSITVFETYSSEQRYKYLYDYNSDGKVSAIYIEHETPFASYGEEFLFEYENDTISKISSFTNNINSFDMEYIYDEYLQLDSVLVKSMRRDAMSNTYIYETREYINFDYDTQGNRRDIEVESDWYKLKRILKYDSLNRLNIDAYYDIRSGSLDSSNRIYDDFGKLVYSYNISRSFGYTRESTVSLSYSVNEDGLEVKHISRNVFYYGDYSDHVLELNGEIYDRGDTVGMLFTSEEEILNVGEWEDARYINIAGGYSNRSFGINNITDIDTVFGDDRDVTKLIYISEYDNGDYIYNDEYVEVYRGESLISVFKIDENNDTTKFVTFNDAENPTYYRGTGGCQLYWEYNDNNELLNHVSFDYNLLRFEQNNYYRTEPTAQRIYFSGGHQMNIEFNYPLDTLQNITSVIQLALNSYDLEISDIYISEDNNEILVVEFNRSLEIGEVFELFATQELLLRDGRTVPLNVVAQGIETTAIAEPQNSETVFTQNGNMFTVENISGMRSAHVFNVLGSKVKELPLYNGTNCIIDLSNLSSSTYFLTIYSNDGNTINKKIIIE